MDYKEKYEKALERAKDMLSYKEVRREDMEYLFPELQETEDEKIRKELIDAVQGLWENNKLPTNLPLFATRVDKWIAWLEKQGQGKQKIAWSEEDEYLLDETIQHLEQLIRIDKKKYFGDEVQYYQRDIDWLKSLKDRIQSKQGGQSFNIQWHDVTEEADAMREIICEWETNDATWHDVAFYHADTKTFWCVNRKIEGVVKWAYLDEMFPNVKTTENDKN